MEKRIAATILLTLSVMIATTVAYEVDFTIRLPSDGEGPPEQVGAKTRPWKCCKEPFCLSRTCYCPDRVKQCAAACKKCEVDDKDPSQHFCLDGYDGTPGPRCNGNGNKDDITTEPVLAAKRPWKCCSMPLCIRGGNCYCLDKLDKCDATCKKCQVTVKDPSLSVCLDGYSGSPGPRCNGNNDDVTNDDNQVMSMKVAEAETMAEKTEGTVAAGCK